MISLILPYWDRQEAADNALRQLESSYGDLDLEVIVVDDGNAVPFVTPDVALNIKVIRLPFKDTPKAQCTPWNAGVEAASGDIVVLSCVEILHPTPILARMREILEETGKLGYILAAAYCPEQDSYHCHTARRNPRNPAGTGLSFCGMMYKSLFIKSGGLSEEYRDGAGYEDNDFINRMLTAGAQFVIRDDLVVVHPKTGASIDWGVAKFQRNEQLYYSKWPKEVEPESITICCVNAGNYIERGREYVEKLYGMVINTLPDGRKFKFVCFTDEPFEHEAITCKPLPNPALAGWNHKISLFKDGVFENGERVIYFDLDTLLIGNMTDVLNYQGEFATLRDFWRAAGFGPAVMLFRGGFGKWIYDKYEKAGFPELERGDQEWMELVFAEEGYMPGILQEIYPGTFCSFKGECRPNPPKDAKVVCFHGVPRPHDVSGWVADVWNGKLTGASLELVCNVERAVIGRNIQASSAREIPWLEQLPQNKLSALLVGGGPSMKNELEFIRKKHADGAAIIAMNGTADFLHQNGIKPDIHLMIDARENNLKYVKSRVASQYYFASQCHPALFDYIGNPTLFHVAIEDWDKYIPADKTCMAIGGGHSVGMYAMSLAYVLGFRTMHLYGYDSSYRDSEHHAYEQKPNDSDPIIEAFVNGRTFKTTNWMVVQVNEFKELASQLSQMGCTITTHGDGLLPYVAWQMATLAKAA